ncbi:MAG: (4Fe-4S)-binding protein [Bacteroidota bacterium]
MDKNNTASFTLLGKGYQGQVITPHHAFYVDEPEALGGKDKFPSPENYLLGALASCTAITIRMYAQRKGWELGQIKVEVILKEVLRKDGTGFRIKKDFSFENHELTNEQIDDLIRVSDKCPVSRILSGNTEMKTEIVQSLDEGIVKTYANDDITVVWKPNRCIHSKKCWKGLLPVFNPQKKPWVNMEGANTERIIEQVQQCPSGALSYFVNQEQA